MNEQAKTWEETVMSDDQLREVWHFAIEYPDRDMPALEKLFQQRKAVAKVQAKLTWEARQKEVDEAEQRGVKKVVDWVQDRIFYCADSPPQEGVAYGYLGNYILRFGKEALPSVGFYELSESPEWQAFLKDLGVK